MNQLRVSILAAAIAAAVMNPVLAADPLGAGQRIVFFGDSFTAGYGVLPAESMPGCVAAKIHDQGWGFTVTNAGESGDTSAQALDRTDEVFRDSMDVLVIFIGANDGFQRVPVKRLRKNLEKIIDRARRRSPHVRILLLDMRMPEEWGAYSREFNEMYPNLAFRRRTAELPWVMEDVLGNVGLTLADGLHPNAEGYRRMADRVWRGLEPILRKAAADKAAANPER